MPKDATKGFVASLADGPAFVVVDAVSGAVKKLRASVLAATFAPSSHVGAGGAAHAAATTGAAGFMSAADKTKLDALIESGAWAPTASDLTNISALTLNGGSWQRVGNMVRVQQHLGVAAAAIGSYCRVTLTLPAGVTVAAWHRLVGGVTGTDALLSRAAPGSAGAIVFSWQTNTTGSQNAWVWADIWVGA